MFCRSNLSAIVFAAALAGCSAVPIQNFQDIPVHMAQAEATLADVQVAIIRGGTEAGWQMALEGPGRIKARYHYEREMAEVLITFNTKTYNIRYLNSSNLNYSAKAGQEATIYEDYNVWIQELDRSIRKDMIQRQDG